nr:trichohyalin isoform X4 [Misgurnus anguillicaudatus]
MMEPSQDVLQEQLNESFSDQSDKAKMSTDLKALRGTELLKTELSRRDANIQRLQQDLLLSHQARDTQSVQLDVQEQRLWGLQRELQESQQELQRERNRNQQLHKELQDAKQQDQKLQAQGDERVRRLEEEVSRIKFQHGSVSQQLQEQRSACCTLQRAQEELKERERQWQIEKSALHDQLNHVREELHSATLREEEHRLKVLQIDELQKEVDMTLALLEKEREDCVKAEELERLREEQLKDKVQHQEELIIELQKELEKIRSEKEKELREWKERWNCVSENLRNTKNQLQQTQDSKDQALRSLDLQQEKNRSLQNDMDQLHITLGQRESKLEVLLQEAAVLRQQLLISQDSLQQVTNELQACEKELKEEVMSKGKEVRRLQEIQEQREEVIEENKHKASQQRERDGLYMECKGQNKSLSELCREVPRWQQEALEQRQSRVTEVQDLKKELESTQGRLQLKTAHRQQRDTEEKGCVCPQVLERDEQILRLRAQIVALRGDLQVQSAQLESGDDALTTLSQQLRNTLGELEHSRKHAQECEMLISTLKDSSKSLRHQMEEQEETLVKVQADFSIYRSTHVHSSSDYESQHARVQELEHALFQSLERCRESAQQLRACQLDLERHRSDSSAELQRLLQLQSHASCEDQSRAQVDSLEQKVANLEEELRAAQRQCALKEQSIQKRDTLLRRSEADLLQAREKIQGKAAEAERQVVSARGLEASLQRAKKEKRQKEKECASLRIQLMKLREELKEAQTSCRDTAQELARQQERSELLERGQRVAQEQLTERVTEVVRGEKTQRRLQAELKRLTDKVENVEKELQDSRRLVERLQSEMLNAQQEATRLQKEKQQIQEELTISRESFSALQTKLSEQERLLITLQERISELHSATRRLQEEEANSQIQLQLCRKELETRDTQAQKHNQEMSTLQATVSKLTLDLEQEKEKGRQGLREATKAQQRARDLKLELSTAQASHKEGMDLLSECSRELAAQKSEQVRLQQCLIQLTEERAAQEERARQLSADLQKVHSESRCSQEEARACEGRLAELHTQLSRSEQWAQQQLTALQSREEEVIMLKMEMASLRENYHVKVAQVEALYSQIDAVDQKYNAAVCEVDVLRQCLGDARCDSSRLHKESELVVSNVNQWVKEQKHTNEKLALQIKDQSRKIIHLTAEKDHLQENVKGLQGEIRRLKAELDNERMETERFK